MFKFNSKFLDLRYSIVATVVGNFLESERIFSINALKL